MTPIELWVKSVVVETDDSIVKLSAQEAFASFMLFIVSGSFKNYEMNSLQFATRLSLLKIKGLSHTIEGKKRLTMRVFDVDAIKSHYGMVDEECLFQ